MRNLQHESLIRLVDAARIVNPKKPPHAASIHRWCSVGVRGTRLEIVRLGGVRWTSREAVRRFLDALNPETAGVPDGAAGVAK